MPPKKSDLHHITFHFHKSAVLLSLPSSTTLSSIKTQLLPAFKPFASILPVPLPTSTSDFQLYEEKPSIEGAEPSGSAELRCLEVDEKGVMGRSISTMGWPRWKRVFVSFKGEDGNFGEPIYTIPDIDDEDPNAEAE